MGCSSSKPTAVVTPTVSNTSGTKTAPKSVSKRGTIVSKIEARMERALLILIEKRKELEQQKEAAAIAAGLPHHKHSSFNRIILRFPVMNDAFSEIRSVFKEFDSDKNGSIDKIELASALKALGAPMTSVDDLFAYAHRNSKADTLGLDFQEFLLCIAMCTVMHLFPDTSLQLGAGTDVSSPSSSAENPSNKNEDDGSKTPLDPDLVEKGQELVSAMQLVLECYVMFDKDGSGTIDRNEVMQMINEDAERESTKAGGKKSESSSNALLSKDRWTELDWDSDGTITFKEFLFALFQWVGVNDEEDVQEEEEKEENP
jgi:calcium-binding protein CML